MALSSELYDRYKATDAFAIEAARRLYPTLSKTERAARLIEPLSEIIGLGSPKPNTDAWWAERKLRRDLAEERELRICYGKLEKIDELCRAMASNDHRQQSQARHACVMAKWLRCLARLALRCWRGQQQGVVNRLLQAEGRLNVPPQVGHHDLLIHNAIRSCPSAASGQRDANHPIHESERWRHFIKNERSMRNVANGNYHPFLGARVSGSSAMTAPIGFGSGTKRRLPLRR